MAIQHSVKRIIVLQKVFASREGALERDRGRSQKILYLLKCRETALVANDAGPLREVIVQL